MCLKPINLSRCAHFHAAFPNGSIALYNQEKSLCKISLKPDYITEIKLYFRKNEVQETYNEFGLVPNFDHSILFKTKKATWSIVRNECHQRNALFYFPPDISTFEKLPSFGVDKLYVGLHLKGGAWVTDDGKEVTNAYWENGEPDGNGNEKCAFTRNNMLLRDTNCDIYESHGLCIQ